MTEELSLFNHYYPVATDSYHHAMHLAQMRGCDFSTCERVAKEAHNAIMEQYRVLNTTKNTGSDT